MNKPLLSYLILSLFFDTFDRGIRKSLACQPKYLKRIHVYVIINIGYMTAGWGGGFYWLNLSGNIAYSACDYDDMVNSIYHKEQSQVSDLLEQIV